MKKLSLGAGAIALAMSVGPTHASDLPSSREALPPPPPPPYFEPAPIANWSGFYLGLNAGGVFGGSDTITTTTGALSANVDAAAIAATGSGAGGDNSAGFIGGGQIGYNWKLAPTIVAGVEVDIQGVAGRDNEMSLTSATPGVLNPSHTFSGSLSASQSLDYLGTVRARVGYLIKPTLLVYGTGGLAYGGAGLSASSIAGESNAAGRLVGGAFNNVGSSGTRVGWTAGGGLEWMFAPRWTARIEYLYYDLGTATVGGPMQLYSSGAAGAGLGVTQTGAQFNGHIVRAGLNYLFGGVAPPPIVAKY
ncbi:MAG: outer membrane beta-barrel protein [Methylocystis sp.]